MAEAAATLTGELAQLCVNAIRVLAMDAVQRAKSGHPGTPMGLAPLCYVLWTRHLKHNPADPQWPNRDRFVLSCGHASMLLYGLLHLSGYELPLDELREFRQWGSRTPGHPEHGMAPGIETTTGPLGQGVANAVGIAIAEAALAARFNHTGHYILDHHTWFVASDGDLMEGVAHEAASLAGHLGLGRLIGFYDDNRITIEGARSLADSEDVGKRFDAYGWHVVRVEDGNDLEAIDDAIDAAKAELLRPTLIIVRTHIAFGSPNKQDTAAAHGAPLGDEEISLTRANLGWQWEEPFYVPEVALAQWRKCRDRGDELADQWLKTLHAYRKAFPADWDELKRRLAGKLPAGWEAVLPDFASGVGEVATRVASGEVINAIAEPLPELLGGSADLAPSTNTFIAGGGDFARDDYDARNLHFGVREHAMGGILNGIALHGGFIPYGATFLVFSDYMRPALRLAAMMQLGTIYVFTHDSIGLGEDGPTHQPVEQLATLRAIPGFTVMRPADAAETAEAWRYAIKHRNGPVALCLTRQKVPLLDRERLAPASGVQKGGYVLAPAPKGAPDLVLLGSGSEVSLLVAAREALQHKGVQAQVVSMASLEVFAQQPDDYRASVLPPGVKRLAVEAAHPQPWYQWTGADGDVVGMTTFGASAPQEVLLEKMGFTIDNVVARALRLLGR